MSSIPRNKEELTAAIADVYEKLAADYAAILPEVTREPGVEGNVKGSFISVCDTVAYLVGWGKLVLKWHDRRSKGEPVEFPETGYKWNQLGELATSFHGKYKDWEYARLLHEHERVMEDILAVVAATGNHDLYEIPWYEKWTLGRMIQLNTVSPMKNMRTKVRRFKRANGL